MSTTPTAVLETVQSASVGVIGGADGPTAIFVTGSEELNIDSIKALLDGVDPAALLPELSKVFDSLAPLCRLAVMVGPVVYCAEGADNGSVFPLSLGSRLTLNPCTPGEIGGFPEAALDLGRVYTVTSEGSRLLPQDPDALYFTGSYREEPTDVNLIPYFMWGNRGLNEMRVWMPVRGV